MRAPISTGKLVLAGIIFAAILCAIRLVWISYHSPPDHPKPSRGYVNFEEWVFADQNPVSLAGEWEFYPGLLIAPGEAALRRSPVTAAADTAGELPAGGPPGLTEERDYIPVPGSWTGRIAGSAARPAYGYGTYRLVIQVPPGDGETYGVRIPQINSASAVYVNGEKVGESGRPGEAAHIYEPGNAVYSADFQADDDGQIEIVIQAANFHNPWHGGITEPIKFGSRASMDGFRSSQQQLQLVVIVMVLTHGVYAGVLYALGVRQRAVPFFGVMMLAAGLLVSVLDDQLLMSWLPINFDKGVKLLTFAMVALSSSLLLVISHLTPGPADVPPFHRSPGYPGSMLRSFRIPTAITGLLAVAVLILPADYVLLISPGIAFVHIAILLAAPIMLVYALRWAGHHAVFILLAMVAYTLNAVWGIMKNFGVVDMGFYPIDFIVAFAALSAAWFQNYVLHFKATESLAQRLKRFNRLKDKFLIRTAHEIRNPLHGMLSIAETVMEDAFPRDKGEGPPGKGGGSRTPGGGPDLGGGGAEPYREPAVDLSDGESRARLELLIGIGRRAVATLDDLLDLRSIEEGAVALELAPVNLCSVVEPISHTVMFMRGSKPIEIVTKIEGGLPPLKADADRLSQILFNLMHNGIKFTDSGSVTVSAEADGGMASITVSDTGRGMDAKTAAMAFEDFSRGAGEGDSRGFGLGLAVVRHLVELHGGTIEIDSAPGEGTSITFTIPLAEEGEELAGAGGGSAAEPGRVPGGTGGRRFHIPSRLPAPAHPMGEGRAAAPAGEAAILAVDDDEVNRAVLREVLAGHVGSITTAASGSRALELLEEGDWDLVIADIMMPGISGLYLTRAIRERFSMTELPVLLLTALGRPEDIESGFQAGANDYLIKPVSAMELRSRAKTAIALKRSAEQHMRLETALLQAQIKPHFIFNTLNSISALSVTDNHRMRRLMQVFGSYLRSSFDLRNTARLVPLAREMDIVDAYLYIQKERFGDRLQVDRRIRLEPGEADEIMIPPFSIQPLVENSVGHGLMSRMEGGTVTISAAGSPAGMLITVADDGAGMPPAVLERLRHTLRDGAPRGLSSFPDGDAPRQRLLSSRGGLGLWNTHRRLQQMFGSGLSVESSPGGGTEVSFFLPRVRVSAPPSEPSGAGPISADRPASPYTR